MSRGKPDAQRVADFLHLLVRATEAGQACPRDAPGLRELQTDLEAALRSCLDHIGDLSIRVDELDFYFEGDLVHSSETAEGSVAHALFRDGVREIRMRRGLEPNELSALVGVIRRVTESRHDGWDDAVTLLWEQGFRHVEYVCVPFEECDPETGTAGTGPASGGTADAIPWPGETEPSGDEEPAGGQSADERFDDWCVSAGVHPPPGETVSLHCDFREIEAENIRMMARVEEAMPPRDHVVEILSGILDAEKRPAEYLEFASILGLVVEETVAEGDFARANQLLDRLRRMSDAGATGPRELQGAAEQVLRHIGRPEFLGGLGPVLNTRPEIDLDELSSFLAALGPSAAPTLCDLLSQIQDMKIRRAVCEALVISCKSSVGVLLRELSDPRWYVVRNVLYVLGRIAHQGVERALGEALYHDDPRVRREAIVALAEVDSPAGRAYLNSALRDPDKGIRILVAQLIAKRKGARSAQVIWSAIEAPEFERRDAEERAAFFEVLGRTGSDVLVPRLERILAGRGWFRPRERIDRKEAALALAWLGTPAALAVLRREANGGRSAVRRAVEDALGEVQRAAPKAPRADWGGS